MGDYSNSGISIQPFDIKNEQKVVDFIVDIQQNEFGIPISASDQPDLLDIPISDTVIDGFQFTIFL